VTRVERWVRRLTVGVVAGVSLIFAVTTALGDGLSAPAWAGVLLLGLAIALNLVAGEGRLSRWAAWTATGTGVLLPVLAAAGLRPDAVGIGAGMWCVAGVLALILLLLWGGRPVGAAAVLAVLVLHTAFWGGVGALASMGVLAMVILLAAVMAARAAILRAEVLLDRSAAVEREAIEWRTLQEAYHRERQGRLLSTALAASPMLQRIADAEGALSPADRAECRLLEQTIRDEIRGRRLLNDAVREQVLLHRRRGASVQVNDDGGLDGEDATAVDGLLHQVAAALEGVTSDRIVIRTLAPTSEHAVSVVATTTDALAAALGLEGDDEVDVWLELRRPSRAAAVPAG